MNDELDSQLSAMFDDELPAAECELLARRLSRDEDLKARWSSYAMIGATIRADGGARLNVRVAQRVSAVLSAETQVGEPAKDGTRRQYSRWWRPLGGIAVAASVAAASILWLRLQAPQQAPAFVAAVEPVVADQRVTPPDSYVVPKATARRSIVPSTQLANYVVAHSEFSSPVNRRNLLSAFMASESGSSGTVAGAEEATDDVSEYAKSPQ